jgi:hypothetical protein
MYLAVQVVASESFRAPHVSERHDFIYMAHTPEKEPDHTPSNSSTRYLSVYGQKEIKRAALGSPCDPHSENSLSVSSILTVK